LEEERQHMALVKEAIESLGGDPTLMSPSADVAGTAALGIVNVLVDPRTNLLQSLEAIMIAELTDNECWDTLVELATKAGQAELAQRFDGARLHEREHLVKVRTWIANGHGTPAAAE
jgi:rubrerythrin